MTTVKERFEERKDDFRDVELLKDQDNDIYIDILDRLLQDANVMKLHCDTDMELDTILEKLQPKLRDYFDERPVLVQYLNIMFVRSKLKNGSENFIQPDKLYSGPEIDILLLKCLQGGEQEKEWKMTRGKIAKYFGFSENTLYNHLKDLQDGVRILGSHAQIELRRRSNNYDSTIHPTFLPLNMSEVYFLSVAVPALMRDNANSSMANAIAADIYSQLSDYAKSIIGPWLEDEVREALHDHALKYRIETDFPELAYFEKSGKRCKLNYKGETVIGIFTHERFGAFREDDGTERILDAISI